jgi:hypothetical protein
MADGSRFFDDIATHLPALLYEPERFTTVQEVLRYVQRQARLHMNRFDRGRSTYRRPGTRGRGGARPATTADNGDALLRAMMGGLFNTTPMTFISAEFSGEPFSDLSSVIVRPTQVQIDAASELIVASEAEGNCAICQEALQATTTPLRRIRHCNHSFHRNCIDVWFTSHVQCPVCRHDIRE